MSKTPPEDHPESTGETTPIRARGEQKFKKLVRPLHATRRTTASARLRGMHRRRRKRMGW
jgi:hypothetical protein